jgi:hypothetical protein
MLMGKLSDPVLLAIIAIIPSVLSGISVILNIIMKGRVREVTEHVMKVKEEIIDTKATVKQLEENTNSKMDLLLAAKDELKATSDKEQHAAGRLEGVAEASDPLYKIPTVEDYKKKP